jgi:uncharacterized protein (UPF0332 family)
MSFNWIEYINLAEELLSKSNESSFRSSISRAYYGIFCIARKRKFYQKYTDSDIHWKVINEYWNSENRDERRIGRILAQLRKSRNYADYDEEINITKAEAEQALLSAKEALAIMKIKDK